MMMYRIAVFFAILGGMCGAIGGVMDYSVNHGGHTWFPGANVHPISNSTMLSQDQIDAMQRQSMVSQSTSTSSGSYDFSIISLLGVGYSMGKGVLIIEPELEKVFNVYDKTAMAYYKTHPGSTPPPNLFGGFLWVLQLGIWCIYLIGVTQIWRNQNYRYNL